MIVYNYDADLQVSPASVVLCWVELSWVTVNTPCICTYFFLFCPSAISVIWLVLWQTKAGQPRYFPSMVDRKDLLSTNFHPPEPTMSYCHTTYRPGWLTNANGTIFRLFRCHFFRIDREICTFYVCLVTVRTKYYNMANVCCFQKFWLQATCNSVKSFDELLLGPCLKTRILLDVFYMSDVNPVLFCSVL